MGGARGERPRKGPRSSTGRPTPGNKLAHEHLCRAVVTFREATLSQCGDAGERSAPAPTRSVLTGDLGKSPAPERRSINERTGRAGTPTDIEEDQYDIAPILGKLVEPVSELVEALCEPPLYLCKLVRTRRLLRRRHG